VNFKVGFVVRSGKTFGKCPCVKRLLLIVIVVLAYANSFTGPFIFDDDNAIASNPSIRHLWPPAYLFDAPQQSTVAGRPLVSLTLALNYAFSGLHPWSYHLVNLLLHAGCVWLLFAIAGADERAFAIAAVWAVHPLLTESVTYIIQRTELLMALCLLLTLYCTKRGWRVGAVAACAAGMACKEVMVVAPVIVWLYDRIFLGGKQRASFYMALAGTWLVLAAILLTGPRSETVLWKHAGIDYLLTQAGVILHYLRLSVWPAPLVIDYDDWPMRANIPAMLAVVALLAATVWALRYRPKLGFLGAWFFLILAPTSSLVPIVTEVAAERRMYLPLIAVVALIAPVLRRWMVPVLVIGLMVLTWQRNQDYRSAQSIWRDAVAKRPGNVRALVNLAAVSSPAEAIGLQQRALAIDPDNAEAQYNLGVTLAGQKRLDEALPHLQRATELSPRSPVAHYNYGLALAQTGRFAEAEAALRRAVALEPHSADAHKQLGVALARQGRVAEALPDFEEAARLQPGDEEARRYMETARHQR